MTFRTPSIQTHTHTQTDPMTWNCFDFISVSGQKVPPFNLEVCIHLECDDIQIGGQVVTFLSLCLHGTLLFLDNHEVGDSRLLQMLVTVYQCAWYHIPEDWSLHRYSCENLKICSCTFPWPFEFLVCSLLSSWCLPLPTFSIWISIASLINFCKF